MSLCSFPDARTLLELCYKPCPQSDRRADGLCTSTAKGKFVWLSRLFTTRAQAEKERDRLEARFTYKKVPLGVGVSLRCSSLLFNPQFQSFKLVLGHALQGHRCGQIQSGNVFHFVAAFYLATQPLYFRVSAHSQKHFIRIGDGQGLFNQAMLNQNAMIRRYCQRRRMGLRSALAVF